jgi:hypothetical protein
VPVTVWPASFVKSSFVRAPKRLSEKRLVGSLKRPSVPRKVRPSVTLDVST